jgi:hypothetical protein
MTTIEAVRPEVQNRQMYLGKGKHVLTFAIAGGKMLNVVAFKDSGALGAETMGYSKFEGSLTGRLCRLW